MAMSNRGLSKLAEECGELVQVVGKLLAYPAGDHPDGGPPLNQRLTEEAADVIAAIRFVAETHDLDVDALDARILRKLALFRTWDAEPP